MTSYGLVEGSWKRRCRRSSSSTSSARWRRMTSSTVAARSSRTPRARMWLAQASQIEFNRSTWAQLKGRTSKVQPLMATSCSCDQWLVHWPGWQGFVALTLPIPWTTCRRVSAYGDVAFANKVIAIARASKECWIAPPAQGFRLWQGGGRWSPRCKFCKWCWGEWIWKGLRIQELKWKTPMPEWSRNSRQGPLLLLDWHSTTVKRVCRSTLQAETLALLAGMEECEHLRMVLHGLRRDHHRYDKSWQVEAVDYTHVDLFTDCRSWEEYVNQPGLHSTSDKRLAIDLSGINRSGESCKRRQVIHWSLTVCQKEQQPSFTGFAQRRWPRTARQRPHVPVHWWIDFIPEKEWVWKWVSSHACRLINPFVQPLHLASFPCHPRRWLKLQLACGNKRAAPGHLCVCTFLVASLSFIHKNKHWLCWTLPRQVWIGCYHAKNWGCALSRGWGVGAAGSYA